VAVGPEGKYIVSGGMDNLVKVWHLLPKNKQRTPVKTCVGHSDSVEAVLFFPDGKTFASGSKDKTVMIWRSPR